MLATSILIAHTIPGKRVFVIVNHTALLVVQVYLLVRYINGINYEIAFFFENIINKDFNLQKFSKSKGKSFTKLYESLEKVSEVLKKSEIETIFKSQYLLAAIQNVGTGLIWFDDKGEVLLANKSTKDLFDLTSLTNISELDIHMKGFSQILKDIRPSEYKLIKINTGNEIKHISINATDLIQEKKNIKLISLQDIKNELNEAELDSWQKLIRVLAHEIMNSIGPITTSITAISKYFINEQGKAVDLDEIKKSTIKNTIKGLEIIEERSVGLKEFVNNYRRLSNLPQPRISEIHLDSFIENIGLLLREEFKAGKIEFKVELNSSNMVLMADEKLISQVVINLLKNSIEALQSCVNPHIKLDIYKTEKNEMIIQVSDNGSGIHDEILDEIFIPFFTTKENGSGIGLSLSRQIMRLHKGSINVISSEKGATLQLIF